MCLSPSENQIKTQPCSLFPSNIYHAAPTSPPTSSPQHSGHHWGMAQASLTPSNLWLSKCPFGSIGTQRNVLQSSVLLCWTCHGSPVLSSLLPWPEMEVCLVSYSNKLNTRKHPHTLIHDSNIWHFCSISQPGLSKHHTDINELGLPTQGELDKCLFSPSHRCGEMMPTEVQWLARDFMASQQT